jgi:hypothetical protein
MKDAKPITMKNGKPATQDNTVIFAAAFPNAGYFEAGFLIEKDQYLALNSWLHQM